MISSEPRIGSNAFTVNNAKFLPRAAHRHGVESVPAEDSDARRLRHVQRFAGRARLPHGPERAVQSDVQHRLAAGIAAADQSRVAPVPAKALLVPGGVQPNLKMPTLISYSLRHRAADHAEHVADAGYVGSHGYHEMIGVDANEPVPTICPASPCPAVYPSEFPRARWQARRCPRERITFPLERRRRIPRLANTWTWFSAGDSSYNALQVDLNHRFSHGLSLRGVYTWSKALDDGDSLNQTTARQCARPGLESV